MYWYTRRVLYAKLIALAFGLVITGVVCWMVF